MNNDDLSFLNTYENYDNDTTIPRSDRAEAALLSSMFLDVSYARSAIEYGIVADDFFDSRHKAIFAMLLKFLEQGTAFDFILVTDALLAVPDLKQSYASSVLNFCVHGSNWKYYCEILREKTTARNALKAANALRALGQGDTTHIGEELLREAEKIKELCSLPAKTSQEEDFSDFLEKDVAEECFSFGLPKLDVAFKGGIHKGELSVVGGYGGSGKSILLGMAALEAAKLKKNVAYFSLEMPINDLKKRIGSNYAGVEIKTRAQLPTPSEMDAAAQVISFFNEHKIHFFENVTEIGAIELLCRADKYDLIVIDYVQLVSVDEGDNREQQISAAARRMKNLSSTLHAVVLTASQLNDDGQLRESRAIGQHANQVIIIEDGSDALKITKNRRGPSGQKIDVTLRGNISRFE